MSEQNCHICSEKLNGDKFCPECGAVQSNNAYAIASEVNAYHRIGSGLAASSNLGLKRTINQDAFWISGPNNGGPGSLAVLCDGVSQSQNSHIASGMAAMRTGEGLLKGCTLENSIQSALTAVCAIPFDRNLELPGPSTTLVAARIVNAAVPMSVELSWAWVGDSRIYWIPVLDSPKLLTQEHVDGNGTLTRCLGVDTDTTADTGKAVFPKGGWIVLCTDGLWGYDGLMLSSAMHLRKSKDVGEACNKIIQYALDCGGKDNVSLVVMAL